MGNQGPVMKLCQLHEGFNKRLKHMRPLLKLLPQRKQVHSAEVGKHLHLAGAGRSAVYAGLGHDYLERGGNLTTLRRHTLDLGLPARIIRIIQALTSDEKDQPDPDDSPLNPPLDHLKQAITMLAAEGDEKTKNHALLVKLADRTSNVRKRVKRDGGLVRGYHKKSADIAEFVRTNYTGRQAPFRRLYGDLRHELISARIIGL